MITLVDYSQSIFRNKQYLQIRKTFPQEFELAPTRQRIFYKFSLFYSPHYKSQGSVTRGFSGISPETAPSGALVERGTRWAQ